MKKWMILLAILLVMPIVQAGITHHNEDNLYVIYTYDNSSDTYSSNLAESSAWDYFTDDCTADDAIYFLYYRAQVAYQEWEDIKFYIGTAFSATSVTFVWEYYSTSNQWTTLTVNDGTNDFSLTGERWVYFNFPTDAETVNINGATRYWIRVRISAVDTPTEGGAQSTQLVRCRDRLILVDDYTAGSPADFDDIKTADDAGASTLMPPMPSTTNMVPVKSVRPVEYGAIKIDFILSGTSAGAGDTLDITGTDSEDNSQSESIDVSGGDDTYTSTKLYKTITDIDCTGWSDGTLEVKQNIWGVTWKISDKSFILDRKIEVSNGSTTYFNDTDKQILFSNETRLVRSTVCFRAKAYGHITLGELVNATTKATRHGCHITWVNSESRQYGGIVSASVSNSEANLYSCSLECISPNYNYDASLTIRGNIYNTVLNRVYIGCGGGIVDAYRITTSDARYGFVYGTTGTFDDYTIYDANEAIYFYSSYDVTFKNIKVYNSKTRAIQCYSITHDKYLINAESDNWLVRFGGSSTHDAYRQYELDLKITDENDNPISGVSIDINSTVDDAKCFNNATTTDANGEIDTQTVTMGYHNITINGGSGSTDIYDCNPYIIKIEKSGYETLNFTTNITEKTDWTIALLDEITENGNGGTVGIFKSGYNFPFMLILSVLIALVIVPIFVSLFPEKEQ